MQTVSYSAGGLRLPPTAHRTTSGTTANDLASNLVPLCASCGRESEGDFRFCPYCGAPLAAAAPAREQRKTVTVLFCDVTGSTALGESTDPEALRALLARYFERMKGIVEAHGGTVEKFIGDAVMAVFGVPVLHEDDALRACRAAVEMRDAFPELGISGRIGVTTGEVVTGTAERLATGDAVNVAARLEQAAAPGEVLIGAETLALARGAVAAEPVEPLALKGKSEPVPAFRLISAQGELARELRDADGRSRDRAAAAPGRVRAGGSRPLVPALHGARFGGRGQVPAGGGVPRGHRRAGGARPLPVLRRGDHVLAGGRDRQAARHAAGGRCSSADPVAARRDGGRDLGRGDRLGLPQADRAGGAGASARLRARRPALGRGDTARSGRARRGPLPRRADPAALHGPPRAAREAAGLGRRQVELDHRAARAARRRGDRATAGRARRRRAGFA